MHCKNVRTPGERTKRRAWNLGGSVVALSAAMLFLPGGLCGHTCQEHFFVEPAEVLSGAVTWVRSGTPGQADIESSDAPTAPCIATVSLDPYGDNRYESLVGSFLAVECFNPYRVAGAQATEWMYLLVRMGDLRQWAEGPVPGHQLAPPDPSEDPVEIDGHSSCVDPYDSDTCDLCRAYPASVISAEVLTAEGGPADYPVVVTPDFLRVIRFEIDTRDPIAGVNRDGLICADTRSATAVVTVTMDASDFELGEMCF